MLSVYVIESCVMVVNLLFNEEIYPGVRIQIKINQKGGNHE